MEKNQNIKEIEEILEKVFDAKQNQPFTLTITLDEETESKTATWAMGMYGPLITTHERPAELHPFGQEEPDPDPTKIDLPFGYSVFNPLLLNSGKSHRSDGGTIISSRKTVTYVPNHWIEKQPDWKCDYAWFAIEGIPILPAPPDTTTELRDNPLHMNPRFVVEPVTTMDWTVGDHQVYIMGYSHTDVSEPHYSGTLCRADRSPMDKREIETKIGVLCNAWKFATATDIRTRATVAYDSDSTEPKAVAVRGPRDYVSAERDTWFKSYDREAVSKVEAVANLIDRSSENVYLAQAIRCLVAAESLAELGLPDIALTTAVNALEGLCEWKQVRPKTEGSDPPPQLSKALEDLITAGKLRLREPKAAHQRLEDICKIRNDVAHARKPQLDTYDYIKMHQAFLECQWLTETIILKSATGHTSRFPRAVDPADGHKTLKDLIES